MDFSTGGNIWTHHSDGLKLKCLEDLFLTNTAFHFITMFLKDWDFSIDGSLGTLS